jgi:hypothetical protein
MRDACLETNGCRIRKTSWATQRLHVAVVEKAFVQVAIDLHAIIVLDGIDSLPSGGFRIRSHDLSGPLPDVIVQDTGDRYHLSRSASGGEDLCYFTEDGTALAAITVMANQQHLNILNRGVDAWNKWTEENPETEPDLTGAVSRPPGRAKGNFIERFT